MSAAPLTRYVVPHLRLGDITILASAIRDADWDFIDGIGKRQFLYYSIERDEMVIAYAKNEKNLNNSDRIELLTIYRSSCVAPRIEAVQMVLL